jgi:hypothetical protein
LRNLYVRGDLGLGQFRDPSLSQADLENNGGSFLTESLGDATIIGAGIGLQVSPNFRIDLTGEYRGCAASTSTAVKPTGLDCAASRASAVKTCRFGFICSALRSPPCGNGSDDDRQRSGTGRTAAKTTRLAPRPQGGADP